MEWCVGSGGDGGGGGKPKSHKTPGWDNGVDRGRRDVG